MILFITNAVQSKYDTNKFMNPFQILFCKPGYIAVKHTDSDNFVVHKCIAIEFSGSVFCEKSDHANAPELMRLNGCDNALIKTADNNLKFTSSPKLVFDFTNAANGVT